MEKEIKSSMLTRDFLNPFVLYGHFVNKIIFYEDGKVIADTNWFESNNYWQTVNFDFEIKKALKVNLDRNDAFFISYLDKTWIGERRYDLYIPASFVGLKSHGVKDDGIIMMDYHTHEEYSVRLTGERYVYEKVDGDYKKVLKQVVDYEQTFSCHHKYKKTAEKIRCERLAEKINDICSKNLSCYDVRDILKHFKITERRK